MSCYQSGISTDTSAAAVAHASASGRFYSNDLILANMRQKQEAAAEPGISFRCKARPLLPVVRHGPARADHNHWPGDTPHTYL